MYYQGYQLIIFEWCFFGFTVPFVLARLYVQFSFRRRPWREVLTVLALLLYIAETVGETLLSHANYFSDTAKQTEAQVRITLQMIVVSMICYTTCIYCCKFVLLWFYMDLTPKESFPKTYWLIIIAWVESLIGCFYAIIYEFSVCRPFKRAWDPNFEGGMCWSKQWYFTSSWVVHTVSEFLVYGIPFIILANLKNLGHGEKKAAYWMFAIGTLNVWCSIGIAVLSIIPRTANINWDAWDLVYSFLAPFWQGSSIIIICLPQVRRLYLGMSEEAMGKQRRSWKSPSETMVAVRNGYKAWMSKTTNTTGTEGTIIVGDYKRSSRIIEGTIDLRSPSPALLEEGLAEMNVRNPNLDLEPRPRVSLNLTPPIARL